MAYTVLARKYRSLTFDDVVGQDPIAKTLKNAIERGVPVFNHGDHRQCAEIYQVCLEELAADERIDGRLRTAIDKFLKRVRFQSKIQAETLLVKVPTPCGKKDFVGGDRATFDCVDWTPWHVPIFAGNPPPRASVGALAWLR